MVTLVVSWAWAGRQRTRREKARNRERYDEWSRMVIPEALVVGKSAKKLWHEGPGVTRRLA